MKDSGSWLGHLHMWSSRSHFLSVLVQVDVHSSVSFLFGTCFGCRLAVMEVRP